MLRPATYQGGSQLEAALGELAVALKEPGSFLAGSSSATIADVSWGSGAGTMLWNRNNFCVGSKFMVEHPMGVLGTG